ncbi:hypothetical protein T265_00798 [Opisthorchis viverrini]|uniref:Uncharacterized protein n=1 Tax=Opisthorchis viverrini TaxID=6198 RepID=A0A075A0R5_OPIVI|nr:hypothetical protein T265_00798 [Opisthorchis viverrini]KER33298.1 hypothetical protein T265_00798 [Opisthorchis viverrini]
MQSPDINSFQSDKLASSVCKNLWYKITCTNQHLKKGQTILNPLQDALSNATAKTHISIQTKATLKFGLSSVRFHQRRPSTRGQLISSIKRYFANVGDNTNQSRHILHVLSFGQAFPRAGDPVIKIGNDGQLSKGNHCASKHECLPQIPEEMLIKDE